MAKKAIVIPTVKRVEGDARKAALAQAMANIEKAYGAGSIMKLGQQANMKIETISTGILSVDLALGVGGLPRGRIIEIYGPESSGKTTVALNCIAEAQKLGGIAAFVDAEHALDPSYAQKLGVDIDELLISQPDTGEQGLEITEALARSGAVDIIVIDSVAALVPRSEIEGTMGESQIGLHARLMSQALRKLAGIINKSSTVAIFINQLREKVGVIYGNPEVTTGGRALKFYSSVRMEVRRKEDIKEDGEIVGVRTRVVVKKNKVAPPFKEAEFDNIFGEGISKESSILDTAVEVDVVNKSGAWFSYNGEKIGQGRDNTRKYLQDNPAVCEEIKQKTLEALQAAQIEQETHAGDSQEASSEKKPAKKSTAKPSKAKSESEDDDIPIDDDFESLFADEEELKGDFKDE